MPSRVLWEMCHLGSCCINVRVGLPRPSLPWLWALKSRQALLGADSFEQLAWVFFVDRIWGYGTYGYGYSTYIPLLLTWGFKLFQVLTIAVWWGNDRFSLPMSPWSSMLHFNIGTRTPSLSEAAVVFLDRVDFHILLILLCAANARPILFDIYALNLLTKYPRKVKSFTSSRMETSLVISLQPTLWLEAIAIVVSVRLSVRKQLPCEHTQGYNSSTIAIIFGTVSMGAYKGWDCK